MEIDEVRGRLHLWIGALLECQHLLSDAARALGARDATSMGSTHEGAPPFTTWTELDSLHQRFTALAVVFFSQVFNTGYGAAGVAASNMKGVAAKERENIVSACFPPGSERAAFDALLQTILAARDEVIAHADAAHFDITHTDVTTISDAHYECLKCIDVTAWRATTSKLRKEIERRLQALGVGASVVLRGGAGP